MDYKKKYLKYKKKYLLLKNMHGGMESCFGRGCFEEDKIEKLEKKLKKLEEKHAKENKTLEESKEVREVIEKKIETAKNKKLIKALETELIGIIEAINFLQLTLRDIEFEIIRTQIELEREAN